MKEKRIKQNNKNNIILIYFNSYKINFYNCRKNYYTFTTNSKICKKYIVLHYPVYQFTVLILCYQYLAFWYSQTSSFDLATIVVPNATFNITF